LSVSEMGLGLRLVQHQGIPEDEEFRRQWNELVAAMERPEVFYTWEWAQAVARVYGASLRLLLFAAYREERLAGIAALAADAGGEVSFLTASTADYCDFVSAPADRQELIELVMQELRGMGIAELRLANLPADSASAPVLRTAARMSGYSVFARPAYFCAQVALKSSEDRAQLSKRVSHKLKRMTKAAGELRTATVDHRNTWEEISAEFPEFAISHVARFLNAGEVSNLVPQERRAFLIELARLLSAQGWLALSTLKIDGRSIAWNYGFRFAGNWFYYQPTFDVEVGRLSPGSYLLCRILQDAASDCETRTVDLGLGDEGYKRQHADAGRQTLYITASNSKARLSWQMCRYRAASVVKRSPGIEKTVRKCVEGISGLRAGGVLGQLRHSGSWMARAFSGGAEFSFLEWAGPGVPLAEDRRVQPVSAKLLAGAAMKYEHEDDTLQYLLRSAKRLQSRESGGFALVTTDGAPVHFCWASPFDGFVMPELGQALKQLVPDSVLMFDCWTPRSQRGRGHYARCTSLVAGLMLENGKRPWIFTAAPSSTAALERAGFVPRFSLVRERKLFFSRIAQLEFKGHKRPIMDLYPAA
jgi:CelD/BcsL family acetyltransferase involved in cellulose biosynthesis